MITIYSVFENLKIGKQNNIINAALKEFAKNGFETGSTNEIVKLAGISKGSLFNYFTSKKDLYLYLLDYSMNTVETMYESIDLRERDIFKRIGNVGIQKLKIQQENPHVFDFLASAMLESSKEVKSLIGEKIKLMYERGIGEIYKDIDYSKFRQDIDIEKAIEILNWTMFGYGEKTIKKMENLKDKSKFAEEVILEWEIYSHMLKENFYK